MNRLGLKRAARQCLDDAECSPALVTLLYWIVSLCFSVPYVLLVFRMQSQLESDISNAATLLTAYQMYLAYSQRLMVLQVVFNMISAIWQTGYDSFSLRLSRRRPTGAGNLLDGVRLLGKVVWLTILILVFTYLWSLLFFIPGIIASYRYRMAYYALLDDPTLTAREALAVSKRITYGHKLELFNLDLSFLGWYLLIVLTAGIAGIWKFPYIQATYAHAYNWMIQLDRQSQAPPLNEYPPFRF